MVKPIEVPNPAYGFFHFPDGQDINFQDFQSIDPSDVFTSGLLALNAARTYELYLEGKISAIQAHAAFDEFSKKFIPLLSSKGFAAYTFMYQAFLFESCLERRVASSESCLYSLFKQQVATLIPGATIVPTVCGKHGRPDFCVMKDGEVRPVEIKGKKFNNTNIRQLRRYMDGMRASHGYAVAPGISCILPGDMTYVNLPFKGKEKA